MSESEILIQSLKDWDVGLWKRSVSELETFVYSPKPYVPAFAPYLWRIWSDGEYITKYNEILEKGLSLGDADCEYIGLWKKFANRPAVDEYWPSIDNLAARGQRNALLARGLHQYLSGERVSGITDICKSYDCMSSLENISYVYHNGTDDERSLISSLLPSGALDALPSPDSLSFERRVLPESLPYSPDILLNSGIPSDDFNAYVFSDARRREIRRIAKNIAPSYADIKNTILSAVDTSSIKAIDGLSKNAWRLSPEEYEADRARHSLYLTKPLSDGRWMTLRIGDHVSNVGDYYKYRRMYVPSDRPYANLSILLHGHREQEAGFGYSIRFNRAAGEPGFAVRDEDFLVYRPFVYTVMHYVHGLMDDKGAALAQAVNEWFAGDGLVPFSDPYRGIEHGPSVRMCAEWVTVETWNQRYERRTERRESLKEINP